ncbi:phosphorylase family protein [Thermaurantiacus sp.]
MGDVKLGIVCGLASERGALGIPAAAVAGARPERAQTEAERLIGAGAAALLSVGIAGALAPRLGPGTLLVPEAVLDGRNRHRASPTLAAALGLPAPCGLLLGSEALVATPEAKAALHQATGAGAVDMESHRVARVAAAAACPFLAIRVIADPHDGVIPASVHMAVGPDGRIRLAATLLALARRPADLPALIRLARASARAHAGLRAVGATLRSADPAFVA